MCLITPSYENSMTVLDVSEELLFKQCFLMSVLYHSIRSLINVFLTWQKENMTLCSLHLFSLVLRDVILAQRPCTWTEQPKLVQTSFKGLTSNNSKSTFLFQEKPDLTLQLRDYESCWKRHFKFQTTLWGLLFLFPFLKLVNHAWF